MTQLKKKKKIGRSDVFQKIFEWNKNINNFLKRKNLAKKSNIIPPSSKKKKKKPRNVNVREILLQQITSMDVVVQVLYTVRAREQMAHEFLRKLPIMWKWRVGTVGDEEV